MTHIRNALLVLFVVAALVVTGGLLAQYPRETMAGSAVRGAVRRLARAAGLPRPAVAAQAGAGRAQRRQRRHVVVPLGDA
jgi:hypothetical protein